MGRPAAAPVAAKGAHPRRAATWPRRALGVLEDTLARLAGCETNAAGMDRQMTAIDRMAAMGVDALREGNALLAQQILLDIQQRTATVRHTAANIARDAGAARVALAGAGVGEYGE